MNRILEKAGLVLLASAAVGYLLMVIDASVSLTDSPEGFIVLALLAGFALLFAQALKDRINNKEDDYYSKNVEK